VVEGTDLHFPRWTPAGDQIVYRGSDDQLHLVNADGTNDLVLPYTVGVKQFALFP
jgi:hypothetical protein